MGPHVVRQVACKRREYGGVIPCYVQRVPVVVHTALQTSNATALEWTQVAAVVLVGSGVPREIICKKNIVASALARKTSSRSTHHSA
jgi:hypothetical protein